MTTSGSVLIWDQKSIPPVDLGDVLCWQSYAQGLSMSSVPRYVEDHADSLRAKYTAFVHDLGEYIVAGKRIVDHLDIGDGFSLWWMSQLAEKSPLKSPRIYDCIRLIALAEILNEKMPADVTLVSSDSATAQAVDRLCSNLRIRFRWQRAGSERPRWSLRRLYEALPFFLKGVVSLRLIAGRWSLRNVAKPKWHSEENALFICSYFIHLDSALCAQGCFYSRQWETLPKSLQDSGRRINWIQHFLFSAAVPDTATGVSWLGKFNSEPSNQGYHSFLDSYLTVRVVLIALKNWIWLNLVNLRIGNIESAFNVDGSAAWLWPVLRDDWQTSLAGPVAINNFLSIALFDAALADIPHQRTGLYLCENQAWEKALLRAWRKHGHGKIIGVQHATVPFWHLYYCDDPKSLMSSGICALPLPDRLAVNGMVPWKAFVETGYPVEKIVQVEALRYLNLAEVVKNRRSDSRSGVIEQTSVIAEAPCVKVLVLGDMMVASMHHLLSMLQSAVCHLPSEFKFTFKAHPGYVVRLADYPGFKAEETKEPLGRVLAGYNIVVAANSTSAAVDAYVAGLPVVIGLSGDDLNLSPLRGQPDVRFVTSSEELTEALLGAKYALEGQSARSEFFFLDPNLPQWKQLLAYGTAECDSANASDRKAHSG